MAPVRALGKCSGLRMSLTSAGTTTEMQKAPREMDSAEPSARGCTGQALWMRSSHGCHTEASFSDFQMATTAVSSAANMPKGTNLESKARLGNMARTRNTGEEETIQLRGLQKPVKHVNSLIILLFQIYMSRLY